MFLKCWTLTRFTEVLDEDTAEAAWCDHSRTESFWLHSPSDDNSKVKSYLHKLPYNVLCQFNQTNRFITLSVSTWRGFHCNCKKKIKLLDWIGSVTLIILHNHLCKPGIHKHKKRFLQITLWRPLKSDLKVSCQT